MCIHLTSFVPVTAGNNLLDFITRGREGFDAKAPNHFSTWHRLGTGVTCTASLFAPRLIDIKNQVFMCLQKTI